MHSFFQRGSALFTMAVTALAIIAGCVSVTDLFHPSGLSTVDINVKGVDAIFVRKGVEQVGDQAYQAGRWQGQSEQCQPPTLIRAPVPLSLSCLPPSLSHSLDSHDHFRPIST